MLRGPMRLAQIALAWVWTTALGRLVVPDVNMMPNGSIGSMGRGVHEPGSPASSAYGIRTGAPPGAAASAGPSPSPGPGITAIHSSAGSRLRHDVGVARHQ